MSEASPSQQFRFCTTCGEEHAIGARFCGRCGAALCIHCGATARPGARFCLRCGKPLSAPAPSPPIMPSRPLPAPPPAITPSRPLPSPEGPLPEPRPQYPAGASPWQVEFVDRQEILAAFDRLVSDRLDYRRIMLLQGTKGIGKSFLLRRLESQCRQVGVAHVRIELADPRGMDDIKIMRDVRDGLGAEGFKPFTDLLNYYTTDGYALKLQVEVVNRGPSAGGGVTIQDHGAVDGVVAGRDAIVIRDNYLSAPRRDFEVDRRSMQDALTRRFLEGLLAVSSTRKIVCLFDDVDTLEPTTAYWLWRDFLGQLIGQANFLAVLTAVTRPELDRGITAIMESPALGGLSESHVIEYLERRGVPAEDRRVAAAFILSEIGDTGSLEQMARMVDMYLKLVPGVKP